LKKNSNIFTNANVSGEELGWGSVVKVVRKDGKKFKLPHP